jgi:alkylation response protein AidB-like acyl-CoA dehydrogenase
MELTLSEDQEFFRDTTRKFLESECPTTRVRELRDSPDGFERDYWRQGAELGWVSMLVPEELGGGSVSGSGVVDLTLVADAFGANAAPGPLVATNVVAAALARSGTGEQQSGLLPALVAGDAIATWAFAEPAPDDGLGTITARAERDGSGFRLNGVKAPVEAGAQAEQLLVTARTEDGLAQFLVPSDASGIAVTPLESIDLTRRYAEITFDGVQVPASAAVGTPGDADADVERQLQLAIVMLATESVGAAQKVFDFTVDWAFNRYSFGRPLASYQELKHRFADMKMCLEASHALGSAVAREVQAGSDSAPETASIAKAYSGDHLSELVQDCVQMHGGIGLTYDHDIHLYLRRVTADRLTYGTPAEHRQRIAGIRVAAA